MILQELKPKPHVSHAQAEIAYQTCPHCGESSPQQWVSADYVCTVCAWHLPFPVRARLEAFFDQGQWTEHFSEIRSEDPLQFEDRVAYTERLGAAESASKVSEALIVTSGLLQGQEVVVLAFAFEFIGGSMGTVVGERFVQAVELCIEKHCPMIVFVASGGARMQEGVWSLVQMGRVSASVARLRAQGILYMTCLCHPTTGGVVASLAMLGDWIVAEPHAYISFTGARVLGVQSKDQLSDPSDLLKMGHIDAIVPRAEQKDYFSKRVKLLARK